MSQNQQGGGQVRARIDQRSERAVTANETLSGMGYQKTTEGNLPSGSKYFGWSHPNDDQDIRFVVLHVNGEVTLFAPATAEDKVMQQYNKSIPQ